MRCYRSAIAIGVVALSMSAALAGGLPQARTPVGPVDLNMLPPPNMVPGGGGGPVPVMSAPDRVRIQNMGNQQLSFVYWDGQSGWQTLSVDAGQVRDVICNRCGASVNIAFHNGKEPRSVTAQMGSVWLFRWSSDGVWELRSGL